MRTSGPCLRLNKCGLASCVCHYQGRFTVTLSEESMVGAFTALALRREVASHREHPGHDVLRVWWAERLRAARRVFNDPDQVERIVEILEAATGPSASSGSARTAAAPRA